MPDQEPPQGAYFSTTYLTPTEPQDDSQRFRTRLAAYCSQEFDTKILDAIAKTIHRDLGVYLQFQTLIGFNFRGFFGNAEECRDRTRSLHGGCFVGSVTGEE